MGVDGVVNISVFNEKSCLEDESIGIEDSSTARLSATIKYYYQHYVLAVNNKENSLCLLVKLALTHQYYCSTAEGNTPYSLT